VLMQWVFAVCVAVCSACEYEPGSCSAGCGHNFAGVQCVLLQCVLQCALQCVVLVNMKLDHVPRDVFTTPQVCSVC